MKIVIDAFGGDNAPLEVIKGAAAARAEYGAEICLTGNREKIESCAADNGISIVGIEIAQAESVMEMHDDAKLVLKQKADSSMAVGLQMLADEKADAFVSAGPTGALLMGATMIVKRIKGVKRPSLCAVIPNQTGSFLLIDCGANTECRPEMLEQFGAMGSIYMKNVMHVKSPRVGLINNGSEDTKGTPLQVEAYRLLKTNGEINFVGNVEGRDIPTGGCDVAVADGFTGNIVLKTIEGMGSAIFVRLKGVFMSSLKTKLCAAVLKPAMREFKNSMDYSKYGGAPIIGLKKAVVKAHGSSNAEAVKNAVRQAIVWSETGVNEEIAASFAKAEE